MDCCTGKVTILHKEYQFAVLIDVQGGLLIDLVLECQLCRVGSGMDVQFVYNAPSLTSIYEIDAFLEILKTDSFIMRDVCNPLLGVVSNEKVTAPGNGVFTGDFGYFVRFKKIEPD